MVVKTEDVTTPFSTTEELKTLVALVLSQVGGRVAIPMHLFETNMQGGLQVFLDDDEKNLIVTLVENTDDVEV